MISPLHARRIALILLLVFPFQNAVAALIAGGDQTLDSHPRYDAGALVSPPGHHDHMLPAEQSDPVVSSSSQCDGDPLCSCCVSGCIPALAGLWGVSESLADSMVFLPLSAPQPARITVAPFRPPIVP